jgi:hypothetical protein
MEGELERIPKWHLETRFIDDLRSHPKNARYLSKEAAKDLRRSIFKFGLIDKPIITYAGDIISGHQRVKICEEMGFKEVECWVIDGDEIFSERDIDELNIRMNKNAGSWDFDKLANEWDVNDLCDWGFKPEEFEDPLPKGKKPKVTFEFDQVEDLEDFIHKVESNVKANITKIKVKK